MEKRQPALDALRGLAIIGMVLSGTITRVGLPAWMYHAQVPPPQFQFNPNVSGITWVDLVFPFFLFAMGAAFPLAMQKRLPEAEPFPVKVISRIIWRGLVLAGFAIALYHTSVFNLDKGPKYLVMTFGLLAFICFSLIFLQWDRLPWFRKVGSETGADHEQAEGIRGEGAKIFSFLPVTWIQLAGWGLLAVLIGFYHYQGWLAFDPYRCDIIILLLANSAVFGAIFWLFTRGDWLLRLAIMAFLLALRLSYETESSWPQGLWSWSPVPFLYRFSYLQYLLIVLPGSIAGEILRHVRTGQRKALTVADPYIGALIGIPVLLAFNLICLYGRYLEVNLLGSLLLIFTSGLLFQRDTSPTFRAYRQLFWWGGMLLLIGLCFEAYEGGIKKDPATLSYYFVGAGLGFLVLLFFSLLLDYFGFRKGFGWLLHTGANPMVGYTAANYVVIPLLTLIQVMPIIDQLGAVGSWTGFLRGVLLTGLAVLLTSWANRRGFIWRT